MLIGCLRLVKTKKNQIEEKLIKVFSPKKFKESNELTFWKIKKQEEGILAHEHYKHFYTEHFGILVSLYQNKIILDIGCGPRGSLEWASMTKRRIGLDPLVKDYLKLGADSHEMEYIAASSEKIPLPDNSCDAVFAFNSLDHVDNIQKSISEIKRVVRKKGIFLLIVEVNHPPTPCEPHSLNPEQIIEFFGPEFSVEDLKVFKPVIKDGIYQSIYKNNLIPYPEYTTEKGHLTAKFIRN